MQKQIMKKPGRLERFLGIGAIVTLLIAWWIGYFRNGVDVVTLLSQALPEADRFEKVNGSTYAAFTPESDNPLAYVAVGESTGYGGPMKVAVAVDLQGSVIGLVVMDHKETPTWYERVLENGFMERLPGRNYQDGFVIGEDLDGVTGATYTSRAIASAVLQASRAVAGTQLGLPVPEESIPRIQFGLPEITLIGLFAAGYFGHRQKFKYTPQLRWASMIIGLVVLGFIYTRPLTLSDVSKFLMGFWPQWQTNLYWYILIGGILFAFTVDNKNPYCEWFCPFGAAQECMGAVAGARAVSPGRFKIFLKWLQRGLAWLALMLALLFRNPGLTSYEVFGTFFDLEGNTLQFALLILVLVVSLFVRRPWCHYLCPLRPVTDFYRFLRNWIIESWNLIREKQSAQ